jgi:hypothetical protein
MAALRGRGFLDDDDEQKDNVRGKLRHLSKEFYTTGIERLTKSWKNCVVNEGDLWKRNLGSVKKVPRIYVNVIIIVNYSS